MKTAPFRALVFVIASAMLAACAGGGGTRSAVPSSAQDYRQGGKVRITPQSVCSTGPSINPCGSIGPCGIYSSTVYQTPYATDDRVTIGVGEEVNMITEYGSFWSLVGGGSLSSRTGSSVVFKAGSRAGTATVIVHGFKPDCDSQSIIFTVIAPTIGNWNVPQGLHTQGYSDIGFYANVYATPNYVNFYNINVQEAQAQYSANGIYVCKNGINHETGPTPMQALTNVDGIGTQFPYQDKSYSGACLDQNQYGTGSMSIGIPTQYRVNGDTNWYTVNTVTSSTNANAGNLSHSKDHSSWSITVDSDTIGCPC
ncbi:MAG: hypothetical protein JWM87_2336 [Candidatus Eremiobacteraeota bacterium]|nr:hypothetical protein [Candidatus Eremiobacteraeota bacterium]